MGYTFTNTASTTAAVTNRLVTSTNMKVGAYTVVNSGTAPWGGGFTVTATITGVTGNDTAGTLAVVGIGLGGQPLTETITLTDGTGGSGTAIFKSVTSITGAGWVINTGNDTIVIGVAAGNYACASGGSLGGVLVNNSVAAAIVISHAGGTIMTVPASAAAGTYYNLGGVNFSGFLKVATTNTNDVTVFHTGSLPTSYSM
jgi:hypothetical protein